MPSALRVTCTQVTAFYSFRSASTVTARASLMWPALLTTSARRTKRKGRRSPETPQSHHLTQSASNTVSGTSNGNYHRLPDAMSK